jgi:hypothetical protein
VPEWPDTVLASFQNCKVGHLLGKTRRTRKSGALPVVASEAGNLYPTRAGLSPPVWIGAVVPCQKGFRRSNRRWRDALRCGVYLGGRTPVVRGLTPRLVEDGVLAELPEGTKEGKDAYGFILQRREADFESTAAEQQWLGATMKEFVNILRPRVKRLLKEEQG